MFYKQVHAIEFHASPAWFSAKIYDQGDIIVFEQLFEKVINLGDVDFGYRVIRFYVFPDWSYGVFQVPEIAGTDVKLRFVDVLVLFPVKEEHLFARVATDFFALVPETGDNIFYSFFVFIHVNTGVPVNS